MTNPRIPILEDRIHEVLARFLERRVKDPRLGFVTITDVHLTGDAREATVFYTVLDAPDAPADLPGSAAALESAKGLLRSTVGKALGLKFAPTLAFVRDATQATAADMESLLAKAQLSDAELAAGRDGAQYAGDPDPYKHDDEDEPEDEPAA
ncbi:MAG: 30S ribosome-binding factor RbfA [Propionibacteriaceae bacterium]|nr:30S ribosome-binding factor RbfA [Propionibacteriaceae bacterium]